MLIIDCNYLERFADHLSFPILSNMPGSASGITFDFISNPEDSMSLPD
jgi:hypothetical protein